MNKPEKGLQLDEAECEYIENKELNCKDVILKLPELKDDDIPYVSIVTPTCNRRTIFPLAIRNFFKIDYPHDKLEWIIVDDGDDPIEDLMEEYMNDKRIRYMKLDYKLPIGKKRNFLAALAKYPFIVHMDDDDYYPESSVTARIKVLLINPGKQCVGCTKVRCYDLVNDETFEAADLAQDNTPFTISESTLAYTKQFWKKQRFNDLDRKTECLAFIKDRESEIINIPHVFVITQFTHFSNTINRSMLPGSTKHTRQFLETCDIETRKFVEVLKNKIKADCESFTEMSEYIGQLVKKFPSKKKLKQKLDRAPLKIQCHPIVCHFRNSTWIKKQSSGKDIVFYCDQTFEPWTPKIAQERGVGGSEEAVIHLSDELSKLGWNVTVYNYCGDITKPLKFGKVTYKPFWLWNPHDKVDILVFWRNPSFLDLEVNCHNIILDLHDCIHEEEFDSLRLTSVKKLFVKSNFHKSLYSRVPDSKITVIPNGITNDYKNNIIEKDPYLMINTSSPDRCLEMLLDCFPLIKEQVPEAKFAWCYGFQGFQHEYYNKWKSRLEEKMNNLEGFVNLGRLNKEQVKELYSRASIFAYPTLFPEIDCISMTKAIASGCVPITTNASALAEKIPTQYAISTDEKVIMGPSLDFGITNENSRQEFVQKVVETMKNNLNTSTLSQNIIEQYNWISIAQKWNEEFKELLE